MKRGLTLIALCLVVAFAAAGCGGTSNGTGITNSPYVGSYVGTFTYNNGGTGEFAVYIGSNGEVSGRGVNVTFPASQTLSGSIQNSGLVSINNNGTAGNITYSGSLALGSGNSLTGTIKGVNNTTMIAVATPSIVGGSAFAGSYQGSFTNGSSQNVNLTFIIDANGNITGVADNTALNTFSTLAGTVSGTLASNAVSITSSAGGGTATGSFSLASGKLTSSLNGNAGLPTSVSLNQDAQQ